MLCLALLYLAITFAQGLNAQKEYAVGATSNFTSGLKHFVFSYSLELHQAGAIERCK